MAQLSLAWIMSQKGIFFFFAVVSSLIIKSKAYRHPLLERPLLKNYMISLVWLISILPSDSWFIFSIGAVDVKLTEDEKKELEAPYIAQAAIGHS